MMNISFSPLHGNYITWSRSKKCAKNVNIHDLQSHGDGNGGTCNALSTFPVSLDVSKHTAGLSSNETSSIMRFVVSGPRNRDDFSWRWCLATSSRLSSSVYHQINHMLHTATKFVRNQGTAALLPVRNRISERVKYENFIIIG